jgi:hypothetical protein
MVSPALAFFCTEYVLVGWDRGLTRARQNADNSVANRGRVGSVGEGGRVVKIPATGRVALGSSAKAKAVEVCSCDGAAISFLSVV